jgi:antitoxin (DNA-binding transcriptional repressor) of toxin-antitoxin stability system
MRVIYRNDIASCVTVNALSILLPAVPAAARDQANHDGPIIDKVATGSYQLFMRSVGLKVLKNKLSEYVRLAAGGETVLVTDRDRVVAEIVPPRPGRSPLLADALLAEAVRQGWLTPPVLAGGGPPPRKPVMALRDLMQDLQLDREDR